VLLGMMWKRATAAGGFWGLLAGTVSSIAMFTVVELDPSKVALVALSPLAKPLAVDMWRALWSGIICAVVTVVVSLATKPKTDTELRGLVYGATELPSEGHLPLVKRPIFWAGVALAIFLVLQYIFW
jgi:SSS family solute:Na+ symporter